MNTIPKPRRKVNQDPRYKGGIFVGFDPTQKAREARQVREALVDNHPLTYGWSATYWHTQLDRQVYQLGSAKMVYNGEAWIVQFDHMDDLMAYTGPMAKITADVKEELSKLRPVFLTVGGQTSVMEVI